MTIRHLSSPTAVNVLASFVRSEPPRRVLLFLLLLPERQHTLRKTYRRPHGIALMSYGLPTPSLGGEDAGARLTFTRDEAWQLSICRSAEPQPGFCSGAVRHEPTKNDNHPAKAWRGGKIELECSEHVCDRMSPTSALLSSRIRSTAGPRCFNTAIPREL